MDLKAGDRFNWLTLVEKQIGGRSRWLVRCDCGNTAIKRTDWIVSGRTKSCKNCSSKRTAAKYGTPSRTQSVGDLGKTYYSTIKYGAEKRGLEFSVSQEFLWELLVKQNFKCALSGMDINLSTDIKNHSPDYDKFTASPDRIDSTKGYTEDNIQWVHKDINRLKNNLSDSRFIELCTLVSNYANQQPSVGNDKKDVPTKVQRLDGEESTNNPSTSARRST